MFTILLTGTRAGAFAGGFLVLWLALAVAAVALVVWALFDLLSRPDLELVTRILWLVVILFLPLIGSIVYLLAGRRGAV